MTAQMNRKLIRKYGLTATTQEGTITMVSRTQAIAWIHTSFTDLLLVKFLYSPSTWVSGKVPVTQYIHIPRKITSSSNVSNQEYLLLKTTHYNAIRIPSEGSVNRPYGMDKQASSKEMEKFILFPWGNKASIRRHEWRWTQYGLLWVMNTVTQCLLFTVRCSEHLFCQERPG